MIEEAEDIQVAEECSELESTIAEYEKIMRGESC